MDTLLVVVCGVVLGVILVVILFVGYAMCVVAGNSSTAESIESEVLHERETREV